MTGKAVDDIAAKEFPTLFKATIVEGVYTPKQVFNLEQTGLF
jgi:hypothetical protein